MENLFTHSGRIVSFLLMFLLSSFSNATTYYFSSSLGDDSRSFSQAQNQNTPWRSIQKLNSIFSSLQPGDNILFKSGDTFHGTLMITKSGSSGAPISFGSYGSGEKPIITGFREIKNWVSKGGNLYEAQIAEINTSLSTVLIDNVLQAMGRYPNDNAANSGYLTINSFSGGTIGSSGMQAPASMSGGEIVIRKNNWIIDRHYINWQSGSSVNYNPAGSSYSPTIGFGFFIQNHPATLDKHGEWYYNKATKKLSIYYQGNPALASIKVATVDRVINTINSASHIRFNNLTIQGSNENLINLDKSYYFTLENCQLEYVGKNAINTIMSRNLTVSNTLIANTLNSGINLGWDDRGTIVRNTQFYKIFNLPGLGQNGDMQGNGIFMSESTSDVLVEYNSFLESGFNAIHFKGNNITVKNNYIDSFCFVKDDGGGIYTFTGYANTTFTNRKIINNIIVNGIGAMDGTKPFSASDFPYVKGIYLDLFANGIEIDGNTIGNVSSIGIFLNNSRNISITNNKIFNTGFSIYVARDHLNNLTRNITLKNNQFLNKVSNQVHLYVRSKDNNLGQIGAFDSNVYSRPINENNSIRLETPGKNGVIDLQTWKDTYVLDKLSTKSPASYDKNKMGIDEFILFDYNNSNSAKSIPLSGTYVDLKGKIQSGSVSVPAYSSVLLLKTEVGAPIENKAPTINITAPVANAQFAQGSNISITANAADSDGSIAKVDFYNGNTLLGTDTSSPYSFAWSNIPAGIFSLTAKATDNKGTETISAPVAINVGQKTNRSPYGGTEAIIPGTVEAENYDIGRQGITYSDVDPGNTGGIYRSDDVDIHAATEGDYTVGWMNLNEWLEYSVNITTAGTYNLDARVAA
ncbi:Ig-like domain-containing protein, partial [Algoriphagus iocasae]